MGNRFKCSLAHGGSGGAEGNTLIVTCDPEFAGLTISASKSGTTYTQTCPSSSPYTVTFHGLEAGTWTISTTLSGDTYSTSVTITDSTAILSYGFNWTTWVTLGGLDPTDYSDLSDVFADEAAVRRLMLVHASADYLIDAVTGDIDVIDDFCADDTAMKWIGLCDYVCDGLTAITGVVDKFLASTYWERYLKDHVPVMTANNAPYGETAYSSSFGSGSEAYKSFDGISTTQWRPTSGATNNYIGYLFKNPVKVKKVSITAESVGASAPTSIAFKLQGYDGETWHDIDTITLTGYSSTISTFFFDVSNDSYYLGYRIFTSELLFVNNQWGVYQNELQFYGRSLNVSVPIMTSNVLPYGECSGNFDDTAYKAFDGATTTQGTATILTQPKYLGYEFPDKVCVKAVEISEINNRITYRPWHMQLKGSDDGFTTESLITSLVGSNNVVSELLTFNNSDAYKGFRLYVQDAYDGASTSEASTVYCNLDCLQFYGVDYSEKEFEAGSTKKWIYDHGVMLEPISEALTAGGTITFNDDYVSFNRTAGANLSIATDSAIDFTSYNYLFTVIDTTGGSGHALIGYATSRTSSESSMTGKKTITAVGSDVKDGLDVSAVNTSEYPIVNATNAGTFNLKELWLAA